MNFVEPILKYQDEFTVTGFSVRTKNQAEMHPDTAKIPALWQRFYSTSLSHQMPVLGVYSDYESDAQGFYTLTVGLNQTDIDEGTEKVLIKAGKYLVFSAKGTMPDTVISLWQQIWSYFSEPVSYQRNFISDFEIYTDQETVEIYIGIE